MAVALFGIIGFALLCIGAWHWRQVRMLYPKMQDERYGPWTAGKFFEQVDLLAAMLIYASLMFIHMSILIANGGETEGNAWTAVSLVLYSALIALRILTWLFVYTVQDIVKYRMTHPTRNAFGGYYQPD